MTDQTSISSVQAKAPPALIPVVDGRALDFVKIAAIMFMVVDHVNFFWLGRTTDIMTLLGRTTFPLFCYAAARAMQKAGPGGESRYFPRLLLGALVSEPVSILTRHAQDMPLNVIFTLAFGVFFAAAARRLKEWQVAACQAGALLMSLLPEPVEFGFAGILLPHALLRVLEGKRGGIAPALLLLLAINQQDLLSAGGPLRFSALAPSVLLVGFFAVVPPFCILFLARDLPQDGRWLSKYFLYAFYPLHLLALWATGLLL